MAQLADIIGDSSLSPILLLGAGICLFAAFAHVLVWAANQRAKANLLFALLSLVVTCMMLVSILTKNTNAPNQAGALHELLRAVLWALLVWFPALHRGGRQLRLAVLLSSGFIAWGVIFITIFYKTGTGESNMPELYLSWVVLQGAAVAHLIHHAFHLRTNPENHLFVLALLLFAGTAVHDMLLRLGLLPQITLTEFGFLFFVLAMSRDLAHKLHMRTVEATDRGRAIRLIADSIPSQVSYVDIEQRFVFANTACRKALGITNPTKMLGRQIADVLPEDQYKQSAVYITRALKGERVRYELFTGSSKDGKQWMDVSFVPDHDEEDVLRGFFVLAYDVTAHRAAEAAARESESRFRAFVENCPMGIFRYELRGDDLIMIGANPATERLLGLDTSKLIGKSILEAFPPLANTDVPRIYRAAAHDGESTHMENIAYDDGHTCCTYDIYAFQTIPGQMAVMFQDVTERRREQAELSRLDTAIDQAAEAVLITDEKGIIKYVNPAFETVTGYTADDAIGHTPRILKSGKHDDDFYRKLWETIRTGHTWRGRFINRHRNGSLYTEQAVISPVRERDGSIAHFVCVKQDISESLRMEQQLRQSQKMEAVGQLAGGVAHDFNNVLQAIEGYTELAAFELTDDSPVATYVAEIRKAADRASNLTRQLLTFSRRQMLQPRPLDLGVVIADIVKMLHRLLGEHIELKVESPTKLEPIMADPGQVEQVLLNLCINARDAMPQGGQLHVGCGNASFDKEFCKAHAWAQPGSYVYLSVKDTGDGIPQDVQERMFEPFFTTKLIGEGTGLGLATVYAVVERHSGLIQVESVSGHGTSFHIYFPSAPQTTPSESVQKTKSKPTGGNETILLAEDDPMVRSLAITVLERAGYRLHVATDGAEAIALLDQVGEKIDIAVLDVIMPKLMGTAVVEELHKRGLTIPVLLSSGFGYPDMDNADEGVAKIFLLRKPYAPNDLLCQVRELLDQAQA